MVGLQSSSTVFLPIRQYCLFSHLHRGSPCRVGVSIILLFQTRYQGSERCGYMPAWRLHNCNEARNRLTPEPVEHLCLLQAGGV